MMGHLEAMRVAILIRNAELDAVCRTLLASLNIYDVTELTQPENCGADLIIQEFGLLRTREAGTFETEPTVFLIDRDEVDAYLSECRPGCWAVIKEPIDPGAFTEVLRRALEYVRHGVKLFPGSDSSLLAGTHSSPRAENFNDDRQRWLAHLSHDFKGPLTAALGYCSLLLEDDMGEIQPRQRDAICSMQRCIQRLSDIAADIFQLSIRSDFDPVRPKSVGNFNGILKRILYDLRPIVEARNLRLAASVDPCPEQVAFDAPDVERVIVNIIENACRFTPAGGSIEVAAYPFFWERRELCPPSFQGVDQRAVKCRLPNCYRVDLQNTGPRIPGEDLARIFDEYVADGQPAGRHSAGLGLAICRAIVSKHGGRIWAENTDAGPRFSFVIPFRRQSEHDAYTLPSAGFDSLSAPV